MNAPHIHKTINIMTNQNGSVSEMLKKEVY